jgi:hypothetical protein
MVTFKINVGGSLTQANTGQHNSDPLFLCINMQVNHVFEYVIYAPNVFNSLVEQTFFCFLFYRLCLHSHVIIV